MNAFLRVLILCASTISLAAQPSETGQGKPTEIVHVATALEHITVLEYGEPVLMVATGSNAFQIDDPDGRVYMGETLDGGEKLKFLFQYKDGKILLDNTTVHA